MNDKGFTFFIFENQDCCRNILDGEPWYVSGFLLILKQWHRMMKLSKEDKSTIPVWVNFYNVPLEFWDGEGLSRVASAVGVPLFMDQLTSSSNRVSFARVCVNIQADSPFPKSFLLANEGESVEVRVEYQGVPTRCAHCNVFGHETKSCVSAQVTKLIELQKQTENLPGDEDRWSKVIAKGKKKMGLTGVVSPTEPSSSSTERKEDLNPVVCVNTAQGASATNVIPEKANAQVTDSEVMEAAVNHITPVVAVLPTEVIEIVEDEMTTKATTQVEAFHSEVMSIAELLHPVARDIRKEVEAKAEGEKILPELIGKRMVSPHSSGSSSKNKSSGRNGSQKKKKR